MDFIYCVWAFNKNYERKIDIVVSDDEESQESTLESNEDDDSDGKPIK